ncbi:heavy metal-binding domain-containing protein [uncultured Tenacibaculum sp.]|uniref:heavy metal-binding domain-containing protein n=1 Tax=uncultured Tenacibaculum sp. TaxID=174713 RepID=UPI0026219FB5|nr:heavy metal-binding domain-containing protein [uncultured Tenacibaculum sp.]
MKTVKTIIKILVVGLLLTTTSCKNNQKENSPTKTEQTKNKGKEYTSAYVCPMHCKDSGSDKEGKCPTCGMDYVKNKDFKKETKKD